MEESRFYLYSSTYNKGSRPHSHDKGQRTGTWCAQKENEAMWKCTVYFLVVKIMFSINYVEILRLWAKHILFFIASSFQIMG